MPGLAEDEKILCRAMNSALWGVIVLFCFVFTVLGIKAWS